ncbi:hypothetical protein F2Q69_00001600 [Brassica cretica]|uniref:Uncharacterized protein n=1 Tax=Brassica cretica TaxID=69181 RepID=A0A8S9PFA0_BRACR|nr:hypothetical protein F2Q69_00001600 [Brassica cretica]
MTVDCQHSLQSIVTMFIRSTCLRFRRSTWGIFPENEFLQALRFFNSEKIARNGLREVVAKQKSHDKGLLQTREAEGEIGLDASLVDIVTFLEPCKMNGCSYQGMRAMFCEDTELLLIYTACVIKTRVRAILCKSKSFDLKGKLILGDYGSICVVL